VTGITLTPAAGAIVATGFAPTPIRATAGVFFRGFP